MGGQREAWPRKVSIVNSANVNKELGIGNVNDHGYRVTQGHAAAWALLDEPGVTSLLVLESDYMLLNSTAQLFDDAMSSKPTATLRGVREFVGKASWSMLRLGYTPHAGPTVSASLEAVAGVPLRPWNASLCPAACNCTPSHFSANICEVRLPKRIGAPHCQVFSFVAYAV